MPFNAELKKPKYWIHLVLIATIVLFLLDAWKGDNMFTLTNVLYSVPLLAVGDITAHTLLRLD